MDLKQKQFWNEVLNHGWQERGPAIVKNKIFLRYQIMISKQEAEDLFQSTLARVIEKETIEGCLSKNPEEVRMIIFGYLKNIIREWWRDEVMNKHKTEKDAFHVDINNLTTSSNLAGIIYKDAFEKLTSKEQIAFELYYLDKNTQTAVKNKMDLSIGTVNSILQEIQNKFYEIFEKHCEVYYGTRYNNY